MENLVVTVTSISLFRVFVNARVPPDVCFHNFRWEDCGKPPEPVMYYWKPRSKCEVGIWRGCLPNLNMFKNEYDCVSTCIFNVRADALDFHNLNAIGSESVEETTLENITFDDNGTATTGTDVTGDYNTTIKEESPEKEDEIPKNEEEPGPEGPNAEDSKEEVVEPEKEVTEEEEAKKEDTKEEAGKEEDADEEAGKEEGAEEEAGKEEGAEEEADKKEGAEEETAKAEAEEPAAEAEEPA